MIKNSYLALERFSSLSPHHLFVERYNSFDDITRKCDQTFI